MRKKVELPNKIKINVALDSCTSEIQEILDGYGVKIEGYLSKMVNLKKEKRFAEAENYKQRLKSVLASQAKMNDLLDQVEQFSFMINEIFSQNSLYQAMGNAMQETSKIGMNPDLKAIIKSVNSFDKKITKNFTRFDQIFGKIKGSMKGIEAANYQQDAELESIVNSRLEQYDAETTLQAKEATESIFNLD